MTPERRSSPHPRSHKIKTASLDESFEVTLASDAESEEDESPEKQNVYMSPRGSQVVRVQAAGETGEETGDAREVGGEDTGKDGGDHGVDTGQTGKDDGYPGGGGGETASEDQPQPQTIRLQVLGDDDTESDSEVTAEIMDVTKSITQQIMDSAVKEKHEVRKYNTFCPAYSEFGYNKDPSISIIFLYTKFD